MASSQRTPAVQAWMQAFVLFVVTRFVLCLIAAWLLTTSPAADGQVSVWAASYLVSHMGSLWYAYPRQRLAIFAEWGIGLLAGVLGMAALGHPFIWGLATAITLLGMRSSFIWLESFAADAQKQPSKR